MILTPRMHTIESSPPSLHNIQTFSIFCIMPRQTGKQVSRQLRQRSVGCQIRPNRVSPEPRGWIPGAEFAAHEKGGASSLSAYHSYRYLPWSHFSRLVSCHFIWSIEPKAHGGCRILYRFLICNYVVDSSQTRWCWFAMGTRRKSDTFETRYYSLVDAGTTTHDVAYHPAFFSLPSFSLVASRVEYNTNDDELMRYQNYEMIVGIG